MPVRIVTDSACDLPRSILERYGITVLPLTVTLDGEEHLDGLDLSRAEFYQRMPDSRPQPTTAAPGVEQFRQVYDRLAAEEAEAVLSIHVSSAFSPVAEAAASAASLTSAVPVTVFDSRQISLGTGFLLESAARAAAAGSSVADLLRLMEAQISRTHLFVALDTVKYLRRRRPMDYLMAGLSSLLRIKPLLKMYEGEPSVEQVRSRRQADQRLLDLMEGFAPLEQAALIHTGAPERAERLRRQVEGILPPGETLSAEITPAVGAQLGPGAAGFVCVMARDEGEP